MKNIIILTGNELRHNYVRKAIASFSNINVMRSYCEKKIVTTNNIKEVLQNDKSLQIRHLEARDFSEKDFFEPFDRLTKDLSNPVYIKSNEINESHHIKDIIDLNPDVIIAYGCSLIKGDLLTFFKRRFLNVHLGLSPYYRGVGTNYWPLVNNEPEYVGATFMHIDEGVDTGDIIHQIRAKVFPNDMPHQIGNRLISEIPFTYAAIIENIEKIKPIKQPESKADDKYYRRRDFSEVSTQKLYDNFNNGMIENYLKNYDKRINEVPIVSNPLLK